MIAVDAKSSLPQKIVEAIRSVVGSEPAGLHEPDFSGNEWIYVKECLDSTFVSSVGKFVDRFESDIANFTGAGHAVALVNGTAALHVALLLAGVQQGDEVLIPTLTFVATANAVTYCGGTPHFVDSETTTLGIDTRKLREYLSEYTEQRSNQCVNKTTGKVIRSIIPMHTFGHPVDIEGILAIAHDFNLTIIEDAAESLGSYYDGQHTGTFGLFGVFSFNGNKIITSGGGGIILTNNKELAAKAKHITTTAKLPHAWEYRHDEIGYNYRMPNINAALGCAQLEQLPLILKRKRDLFKKYKKAFAGISGINLINEASQSRSNFWLQTLLLEEDYSEDLNLILHETNQAGIMTRPSWVLMNELLPYNDCPHMNLDIAKSLSKRLLNIPSNIYND